VFIKGRNYDMNLKRNLFLAGICSLVLIMIIAILRWPTANDIRQKNQLNLESKEPALITQTAPSPIEQDHVQQKTIPFPKQGIPVLMYHSISTISGNSLGVPVKQFTEEIEWLQRQSYHSISSEDLYQALVNKTQVPEKPILLTFDDGYADNYSAAWPILKQNGFRATFFVVTNSVGPGMMTWDQLNDLTRQGNFIGSHTVHHLDLATLSQKQQESELQISKQELENHLGIQETALCFPSGKYNKITQELMPKFGYKLGFTTKPGRVHLGDDLLELHRERIYGGMPISTFQKLFP
jgi:peptidoglycan/xylan/chitin deacetylase (PgdA/CDA1 family)